MFGIDLIDASLLPAMFIALIAGFLSFASPCVLPIVPPYLAYMGGVSVSQLSEGGSRRWATALTALSFGGPATWVFVAAMAVGMAAQGLVARRVAPA